MFEGASLNVAWEMNSSGSNGSHLTEKRELADIYAEVANPRPSGLLFECRNWNELQCISSTIPRSYDILKYM
jgi:hypothetical protein